MSIWYALCDATHLEFLRMTFMKNALLAVLISAGVIVRNRSRIPGCEGCLRITVGTPAENARMIETVKNFRL